MNMRITSGTTANRFTEEFPDIAGEAIPNRNDAAPQTQGFRPLDSANRPVHREINAKAATNKMVPI